MANFKIIRDLQDFLSLKQKWDSIWIRNNKLTVFQSFEWNFFGWKLVESKKYDHARLFIIYVTRDGHSEEAILPFRIDGDGTLRFLCTSITDIQDVITPKHDGNWHVFFDEIAKFLIESNEIRRIELTKMEPQSEMLAYLGVYVPKRSVFRYDTHSVLLVSQAVELSGALMHLNSKDRSYVRSLIRACPDLEFKVFSHNNNDRYPLEGIKSLREIMILGGRRTATFCSDDVIGFMGMLYELGICEVASLIDSESNFKLASFRLVSRHSSVFWIVLYSDPKLTTISDAKYMDLKVKTAGWCFYFGTGSYSYKLGTFRPYVRDLFAIIREPKWRPTIQGFRREVRSLLSKYIKGMLQK